MDLDDTVCFCFHVTYRKLRNYARHHKPPVASLMSECLGAGTGCGWCRKIIVKIWEQNGQGDAAELPSLAERAAQREQYWLEKFGKAPQPGGGPPKKDP
jgi:bacterioferritin-associated ferredoxin